jgi:hypothetical protein
MTASFQFEENRVFHSFIRQVVLLLVFACFLAAAMYVSNQSNKKKKRASVLAHAEAFPLETNGVLIISWSSAVLDCYFVF